MKKRMARNAGVVRELSAPASLSLQALSEAEAAGTDGILRAVIPAPGKDGYLKTESGPAMRMSDPAALAAALNAQETGVRIDFDHRSEPSSSTFQGSTAAEGWAKSFRATAAGAVEASLELSSRAREALAEGRYKYLSPALWLNKHTEEVVGMNSLALVNNPNMASLSLNNKGGSADTDPSLDERERRVAEQEKAAERLMMNAAERAVDTAIEGKRITPAQKEFVLNAIRTHGDGIEKGIDAFEKAYPADAAAPALNSLDRRVGPTGAPTAGAAPAAKFRGPLGVRRERGGPDPPRPGGGARAGARHQLPPGGGRARRPAVARGPRIHFEKERQSWEASPAARSRGSQSRSCRSSTRAPTTSCTASSGPTARDASPTSGRSVSARRPRRRTGRSSRSRGAAS